MSLSTSNKKRTLDDVFSELVEIKNKLHFLSDSVSALNNKFPSENNQSNPTKRSRSSVSHGKPSKDHFDPVDEKALQILMTAILYSASQIGVSSLNADDDQDLRHALGIVIPRSCCLYFQNTNQHVSQPKEKFEIVVYIYSKQANIDIPVVNFVTNVRIIHIKSIATQIFEQTNNTYPNTLFVLIVQSEIPDMCVLENHKNLVIISLLEKDVTFSSSCAIDDRNLKIAYLPQMLPRYSRLIRYLVYFVSKNAQTNATLILEEVQEIFKKVDSSHDFSNGVFALYSPLFACILSVFSEIKPEWKHLTNLVYNANTNESYLTNQMPWSKVWRTNREFLSHLSLNEFLKTYDSKYQPGTNERSKFISPNIVSALFCDHNDKHEAKNFIFVPVSTITRLLKSVEFKGELASFLKEITPQIIQKGYTKFQHRKTFDIQKIPEKITNCLIDESILPELDEIQSVSKNASPIVPSSTNISENENDFTDWGADCDEYDEDDDGIEEGEDNFVQQ